MTRYRSEKHLRSVRGRPCLCCYVRETEAHHITYAEPNAMSMKVGDQFTVPMCHEHHMELHRFGDERTWWDIQGIDPLAHAKKIFEENS